MLCGGSGWLEAFESCDCVATYRYRIQQLGGGTGAYSGKELRDAKARYPIARIIGPPQRGQNILDVRSFEELEAAELHEGNVFSCQLQFQNRAVVRGAKQDRLRLQANVGFAISQDCFDDIVRLCNVVGDIDQRRKIGRRSVGPEILGKTLGREVDNRIGRREDWLCRAIILLQRDQFGLRSEVSGKVEDVANIRRSEGIDRLSVVSDHRKAATARLKIEQDRGL
jgi:hypothetical protein